MFISGTSKVVYMLPRVPRTNLFSLKFDFSHFRVMNFVLLIDKCMYNYCYQC